MKALSISLSSTAAVQIQLAGKKTVGTFVACQIFSVFHSNCTDSTWGQKKTVGTCVACQIFSVFHSNCTDSTCRQKKLKDRITPHVTNFFTLRLSIEKQEGKRKYKSDGAVMVGEFVVCVCVCMFMSSE